MTFTTAPEEAKEAAARAFSNWRKASSAPSQEVAGS